MTDHTELQRLAKGMKGWDKMTECWPSDENGPDWQVGRLDEDDNRWPLLTIDTEQYDQEQDAPKIAQYYAAANPAAVLGLIAENERVTTAWHDMKRELDQLKAENEALRKDAERYRFLRRDISNHSVDFCIVKKFWDRSFHDTILETESADAQIDAAMSKEG